ncbi:nucleotidyl transferase AbiEii/AbiGii toxin family protein [Patescibacteria group bacterium]|nr:nucleotidyl transferase AbiEii/AbiGii toxin family protein [Patescibacteria group bacterium]MCG2694465.1 nucleotidyl transferase AbiEii/AbiGii toxin family protein [Candidatus Parcubacteria bacterium]
MQNNKLKKELHPEILTKEQKELLPLVKKFYKKFGLVGGTAIALHIGHRESIDFDLFSYEEFKNVNIKKQIARENKIDKMIRDESGQFTLMINDVLFTFFNYPFEIDYETDFDNTLKIPSLLTLAAMKLFALGRRAKWKDYVDLYFIIKSYHSLPEIMKHAKKIFKNEFNEKICREQLAYFKDINYSEEIVYKKGFAVSDKEIKKSLVEFSLS